MFDAQSFMNTQIDNANATDFIVPPNGEDWIAEITKVEGRQIATKNNPEQVIMDVTWNVNDERVKAVTHREQNFARQSLFLDMTPSGGLDMGEGMNIGLGRLRKALGQNQPGRPWAPSMLVGQVARVKTEQRVSDNGTTFCDVKAVIPL